MDRVDQTTAACPYCGGSDLHLLFAAGYHPYLKDHGPWDLHRCNGCGSLTTFPLPSSAQLSRLYASFEGGMIPAIRHIRDAYPLDAWFRQCLMHALRAAGRSVDKEQVFSWADHGAGAGEMSALMATEFPRSSGVASDLSERPSRLLGLDRVKWLRSDRAAEGGAVSSTDLALSITVVEHLPAPDASLRQWIGELAPGGCLYLTTPRADCTAFRLLGRKWPYHIPGEHLHIPTRKGMRILLERIGTGLFGKDGYEVEVRSVVLPYPLGYFLRYFRIGAGALGGLSKWPLKVPTGLLEASIRRK